MGGWGVFHPLGCSGVSFAPLAALGCLLEVPAPHAARSALPQDATRPDTAADGALYRRTTASGLVSSLGFGRLAGPGQIQARGIAGTTGTGVSKRCRRDLEGGLHGV